MLVRWCIEDTKLIGHRTLCDANLVTFLQARMFAQNDVSVLVLMLTNIRDNIVGDGSRKAAVANQFADADGGIKSTPSSLLRIHADKQITRKEW